MVVSAIVSKSSPEALFREWRSTKGALQYPQGQLVVPVTFGQVLADRVLAIHLRVAGAQKRDDIRVAFDQSTSLFCRRDRTA